MTSHVLTLMSHMMDESKLLMEADSMTSHLLTLMYQRR